MPKNPIIPTLGLILVIVAWAPAGVQDPPAAKPDNAAVAAPAKPAADVELTPAEKTIDTAISSLKRLQQIEADIKVSADMLNQKFQLSGTYKRAPGNRVYLLLSLVGSTDASDKMLQVCDGLIMWDFIKVLDSQRCTKRSMEKIAKVLASPDCDPTMRDDVMSGLGFSGPDSVLAGLRKSFHIDQMRDTDSEGKPIEFQGKPIWIIAGSWKDEKTPVTPGSMGGNPAVLPGPLPSYVPSLVYIYMDKETYWPYQVIFEGRSPAQIEKKKQKLQETQIDATGRSVSKKLTAAPAKPSKVILQYTNVKINQRIPDETFAFTPPANVQTQDETDLVVSELTKAIEVQAERKRAQSAKAGPILDGSVPATAPGSEGPAKAPEGSAPVPR